MAKKSKKNKEKKYKFIQPETLTRYKEMDADSLLKELLLKDKLLKDQKKEKKESATLKDLRSEIKEHNEKYAEDNELIENLVEELKAEKEKRDEMIFDTIENKRALEGGFTDAIKAHEEHRQVLIDQLQLR